MIPLSMIEQGEKVKIVDVRAGKGLSMRLANMGLYPGHGDRGDLKQDGPAHSCKRWCEVWYWSWNGAKNHGPTVEHQRLKKMVQALSFRGTDNGE